MFIIANATNQVITVDHLNLEVGHHVEQEAISRNMMIARNQGLITIQIAADLHPGSLLSNPNGANMALTDLQIEEALGFTPGQGGGSGTVTSVGLTMPAVFTVTGGPVTSSGTLAVSFNSQTAGRVLASPTGASGVPTFRALASTDLPVATSGAIGAVKPGTGLTVAGDGTLNVTVTAPTAANPTASAGLSAVNGSAATFMRSDAAPAISQAIVPTWTGKHTFSGGTVIAAAAPTVAAGQVGLGGTTQTTVGAPGGATALPATPTGYILINVAGTPAVVPYYAAS